MSSRESRNFMAEAASRLLNDPAARAARETAKEAHYQAWIDAGSPEQREKVWGVASGAEMFFKILEKMERAPDIANYHEELAKRIA